MGAFDRQIVEALTVMSTHLESIATSLEYFVQEDQEIADTPGDWVQGANGLVWVGKGSQPAAPPVRTVDLTWDDKVNK